MNIRGPSLNLPATAIVGVSLPSPSSRSRPKSTLLFSKMLARSTVVRSMSLTSRGCVARFYSDGSDGPIGSGGTENNFIKREKAKEDYFVRQHEKEQMQRLKEQLKEQQKKIDSLTSKINSMSK